MGHVSLFGVVLIAFLGPLKFPFGRREGSGDENLSTLVPFETRFIWMEGTCYQRCLTSMRGACHSYPSYLPDRMIQGVWQVDGFAQTGGPICGKQRAHLRSCLKEFLLP